MKVLAVPKIFTETAFKEQDDIINRSNIAWISILDTDAERIFEDDCLHLTLWFDDIHPKTTMTVGSCMDLHAMDFNQAKKIISFIENINQRNGWKTFEEIDTIIVHCTAGVCRSGAVADFLRVILDVDDVWFANANKHIIPNDWVLDLLWMTWKFNHKKD